MLCSEARCVKLPSAKRRAPCVTVSLCHCVTVSLCHCVTVSCCRSPNGWFNAASVSVRRWTARSSRTLGSVIKMNRFLSPSSLSSSLSSYISACSSFLNFHLLCLLRLLPLLHLLLILVLLSLLRLHLRIQSSQTRPSTTTTTACFSSNVFRLLSSPTSKLHGVHESVYY